jgi:hypothetical protein
MPSRDSHDSGFELPFFLCVVLALLLILFATGCAHNPKPTRPEGVPYPTKLRPRLPAGVYGINQTRCLGGGIGGCSWSGKAIGGPVN